MTVNLCDELYRSGRSFTASKAERTAAWVAELKKYRADIIFFQETDLYNIAELACGLNMNTLSCSPAQHLAVLIAKHIKKRTSTMVEIDGVQISCHGVHLTDVPSVLHHIKKIPYKSSVTLPITMPIAEVLRRCQMRMPPLVRAVLAAGNLSIVAGDFNEPSCLDLPLRLPTSRYMIKNKYTDTYRALHKASGYTWPINMYLGEPPVRVDYIYTRGFKVIRSTTHRCSSDHRILISQIEKN
jgi:endonuclease/exonuclease/phosphatase family metal-dependent hydrolase